MNLINYNTFTFKVYKGFGVFSIFCYFFIILVLYDLDCILPILLLWEVPDGYFNKASEEAKGQIIKLYRMLAEAEVDEEVMSHQTNYCIKICKLG